VGDRVFVTASSGPRQDRLHVVALNAADGSTVWHRQLWATGHTECHPMGSAANNTPASDGERIFAFYSSNDLACFDLDGNLKWFRGLASDYPSTRNDVGMASSVLVVGDTVVVQCENQGESFVAGVDKNNGLTRWRLERDHDAVWSSPTVLRGNTPQEDLVLIHGRGALTGHDPQTGEEVIRYEASVHTVASVTTHGNRIYLPANGLHALEYDAASRKVEPLWYEQKLRGGNSSPVVFGNRVLRVRNPAILSCAEIDGGRKLWDVRLEGAVWATPLVAGEHAYVASHEGKVFVVRLGEKGELVSTNFIGKGVLASPVAAGGALYLRNDTQLLKVAAE
jgi:outer membrane protein assembly factor BamB